MATKTIYPSLFATAAGLALLMLGSCKKDEKEKPVVTTAEVSAITETTATGGGNITSDGGAEITASGVCWSAGRTPTTDDSKTTDGSGSGSFSSDMTDLVKNTEYYVVAYATNSEGTSYGDVVTFTTGQGSGTVTDVDGNIYDEVTIGSQVWLVQNLKVTHYRNGDAIENLDDNTEWCNFITGAYCDYLNDVNNVPVYGRLYNSYAVTDERNIAPEGWHVATDEDWQTLIEFLGGAEVAGGKLKETGEVHWEAPNTGASNESGFTATPGGYRFGQYGIPGYGKFINLGKYAYWWSASGELSCELGYDGTVANLNDDVRLSDGFSVRCVKDQ